MTFVDPPPPTLGEIVYSWTNNGPDGPKPEPMMLKVMSVSLLAGGGLIVGLIGFFVVGGILQHQHHEVPAAWFLYSLGAGVLVGALIGLWLVSRPAKILTLYVGKDGCAQISGGQTHLLDFRQVESIRTHISVMSYKGVRTSAREFHVRSNGKERLWYVSSAPGEQKKLDPNYDFGEAVLKAFEARRK
jgi:hypothetical protein